MGSLGETYTAGANFLVGGASDDRIYGGSGVDYIQGGQGNDTAYSTATAKAAGGWPAQ